MKNLAYASIALFAALVVQVPAHAQSVNVNLTKTLEIASDAISVKLSMRRIRSENCVAPESWRWGAEGNCPSYLAESMIVTVGEHPIYIPLSAFIDLGDPRSVQLEPRRRKGRFAIVIRGGDAATSYEATLELDKSQVLERVVRHGEFPEQSWEKTTYKFNM